MRPIKTSKTTGKPSKVYIFIYCNFQAYRAIILIYKDTLVTLQKFMSILQVQNAYQSYEYETAGESIVSHIIVVHRE